jgi:hypothetical protein
VNSIHISVRFIGHIKKGDIMRTTEDIERMSRISRRCALTTAKEFADLTYDKINDCMVTIDLAMNDLQTCKEAVEETLLQLNNGMFEDCM